VTLCLRTSATNRLIVHPPGDIWAWITMVIMMMPPGDNSWFVYQSSLVVLPAERSGKSSRNRRRSENVAYQYLKYLKELLTCRRILQQVACRFTSHTKEGVLRIFIAVKNTSLWPGLNTRPLGPVISTLTTTPPRWLFVILSFHSYHWTYLLFYIIIFLSYNFGIVIPHLWSPNITRTNVTHFIF
jgi:hypothetical protein